MFIKGGAQSGKGERPKQAIRVLQRFLFKNLKMCVFNDSLTVESHLTIFPFFLNEENDIHMTVFYQFYTCYSFY